MVPLNRLPWQQTCAPLWFQWFKANGSVRLCVDLHKLNQAVVRESLILPNLEYISPKLVESKMHSIVLTGLFNYTCNPKVLTSLPLSHPLGGINFTASPLVYLQRRKYTSGKCVSYFQGWTAWRLSTISLLSVRPSKNMTLDLTKCRKLSQQG